MPFPFPLSNCLPSTLPPPQPKHFNFAQYNMPPIFQVNNYKPWAPPHGKPFPPHKSPNSHSQRTSNSPCPEHRPESLPSTLPIPQHHLPVRPPAEVCMHLSLKTRPYAPLSPRNHTGEVPITPPNRKAGKMEPLQGSSCFGVFAGIVAF
jgi:hypothetical protein